MNRQFAVIISMATVLLVALLIVLSIFRSRSSTEDVPNQVAFPTSVPNRTSNNINSNYEVSLKPKEDLNALYAIRSTLPYETDSLSLDYSALAEKVYIEKKTENADDELKKFLEANGLTEIYAKFPNLFVVVSENIRDKIKKENDKLFETYNDQFVPDQEDLTQTSTTPTPTPNPNDPSRDIKPVMNVFKTLMGFNTILTPFSATTTSQRPAQQTGQQPATSGQGSATVGNFQNGFPVSPADTTKIPCPISPTVSEVGNKRIYANGVGFYNIKLCKVHGYYINSIKAKDFDNMYKALKLAGFTFKGNAGNFRTYEVQAANHQKAPNRFAPAGSSNHERGLAVDSACSNIDGSQAFSSGVGGRGLPAHARSIASYSCYKWLHNNSSRYGLLLQCDGKGKNGGEIAAGKGGCETWHLSPTGG